MFSALIILCSLVSGQPGCYSFEDTLGPYKTKAACEERVKVMAAAIYAKSPLLIPPGPPTIVTGKPVNTI